MMQEGIAKSETKNALKNVQNISRPIVLIGLMGSGKSTVGKRLAAELDMPFTDSDTAIEEAAQMSISEMFDSYDEAYFRSGERRVIERLMKEKIGVIATGGGAFIDEETRALILSQAISIWIDCPIDVLVERTSRRDTRPLLRGKDPHTVLSQLYAEREGSYQQAHIRVHGRAGPHENTVAAIIEAIDAWL